MAWTTNTCALVPFISMLILMANTMAQNTTEPVQAVQAGNTTFSNSIYQILARQEGNVFFSPLSIQVILALTYLGARGNTAQQMSAGLHLPADDDIKYYFYTMLTNLKSDEMFTLDIANKLFVEQSFTMRPEYVDVAKQNFLAEVGTVDFRHNVEAARIEINTWVENKTNGSIKDLLAADTLDAFTSLVLVNAVYFKGSWVQQFNPWRTQKQSFHVTTNEIKEVDMMHLIDDFAFSVVEELDCKVLEMPYQGKKLSMVIFLPNQVDGLANLEAKLSDIDLPNLMSRLHRPRVEVWLPKFKMELLVGLNPVLKELGMVDMFDDHSADLSGIAGNTDGHLFVSNVVHKSYIEVDEKGSVAAAATGVLVAVPLSGIIYTTQPEVFKADHPFVFHIRDVTSGNLLFVGRLSSV